MFGVSTFESAFTGSSLPNVRLRKQDGSELLIVGTAHAGMKAYDRITNIIKDRQPDYVGLELCQSRLDRCVQLLGEGKVKIPEYLQEQPTTRTISIFSILNTILFLPTAQVVATIGGDAYGEDLFSTAAYATRVSPKSQILAIDRDQFITIARWNISWSDLITPGTEWQVCKCLLGLAFFQRHWVADAIQTILQRNLEDIRSYIPAPMARRHEQFDATLVNAYRTQSMSADQLSAAQQCLPSAMMAPLVAAENGCPPEMTGLHPAIVQERDRILAYTLYHMPGQNALAVVGAGHLKGIHAHWGKVSTEEFDALCQPPALHTFKTAIVPAAVLCGTAFGAFRLRRSSPRAFRAVVATGFGVAGTCVYLGARALSELGATINTINNAKAQQKRS